MLAQKIFYERTPKQTKLLAAACHSTIKVDDNLEQTKKRKNSVEDSRLPCLYCKHKFNTDALGPGLPRLTRGCQRDMKIGSREHNSLLRKWRKMIHTLI